MRTYYRSREALVTDEYFVWRTTGQIFPVAALHDVRLVRGEPSRVGLVALAATTAGLVTLAGTSWALVDPSVGYTLAAAVTIVAALAARRPSRATSRERRVEALYLGTRVTLYASADERVFNQVTRALRRSIESSGPDRDGYGLAAA
ncbi:DUF6232 family protein [Actinoplanes sp. N902-109]|uniref:DUF6232 family protein n=1 Tax=Actinoplanes sp. (strain N902-109) TaxID=649831 RepID=UPI000329373C|nr:DUF6232 family protein [Actinoplanes sp. N902-109]AGL14003.1 hypothetical protein L083_0493 [Actinoplanes sp. N902-109]